MPSPPKKIAGKKYNEAVTAVKIAVPLNVFADLFFPFLLIGNFLLR